MSFLLENISLVAIMIASALMFFWPTIMKLMLGTQEVGTLEATRLINQNAVVLDIRDEKEMAAGKIANARHIPLPDLTKRLEELAKFKEKPIVVICAHGNRSMQATNLLTKNAFTKVYSLQGGIKAWIEAGLPVQKAS